MYIIVEQAINAEYLTIRFMGWEKNDPRHITGFVEFFEKKIKPCLLQIKDIKEASISKGDVGSFVGVQILLTSSDCTDTVISQLKTKLAEIILFDSVSYKPLPLIDYL